MECPYCNTELTTDDDKALIHVGKYFLNFINPISALKNICVGAYNVGKTIYYDFSDIPQTDSYLYCPHCKVYFICCCHCGHPNFIGDDIMVSPKKITCINCKKQYVYATHPDPDADHGF